MFSGAEQQLFANASRMRKQPTFAEELLWNYLSAKPLGFKFRRQHPFANYILDFYCHELKLVVEVDGSIHQLEEVKEKDSIRQNHLEKEGLSVIRFSNEDIRTKPEIVIKEIENRLRINTTQI